MSLSYSCPCWTFKVSFFKRTFLLLSPLAPVCLAEDFSFLLLQVKQQFEERLEKIVRIKNRLVSGSRTRKNKV